MINRDFLEKVGEMAKCEKFSFHGIDYTTKNLNSVMPPSCGSLQTTTLESIVDFIMDPGNEIKPSIVHIVNPVDVVLVSKIDSVTRGRETYIKASYVPDSFHFGAMHSVEEFIIALQSQFIQTEVTDTILRVVGNITDQAERKTLDDGVTQTVTTKQGIAKVGETMIPNPVKLQPRRTFAEIEQPESMFVFRMKGGDGNPRIGLFEADGGAWKLDAIASIKEWLTGRLPETIPVIA